MDREFLDLYNRELKLLQEQARDFAEEYPGIAERLGGLVEDRSDPMIAGLLEGAAFMAARVRCRRSVWRGGRRSQPVSVSPSRTGSPRVRRTSRRSATPPRNREC